MTDDGNYKSVGWALEYADREHPLCIEILEKMALMRPAAVARACKYRRRQSPGGMPGTPS